jgi:hypothetical protein
LILFLPYNPLLSLKAWPISSLPILVKSRIILALKLLIAYLECVLGVKKGPIRSIGGKKMTRGQIFWRLCPFLFCTGCAVAGAWGVWLAYRRPLEIANRAGWVRRWLISVWLQGSWRVQKSTLLVMPPERIDVSPKDERECTREGRRIFAEMEIQI